MPNTRLLAAATIALLFGTCIFAGNAIQTPLYFEQNKGQTDAPVRFLARGGNLTAFITQNGFTASLNGGAVSMHVKGANPKAQFVSENAIEGVSNYYLGSRVITGVLHYSRVRVSRIRDGIDLVYHGSAREVEYDFVIHPGADPDGIRLQFDGAARTSLAGNGDLVLKLANGELRQKKPKVWQEDATGRHEINCRYVLGRRGEVRLNLGSYSHAEELVIDPVLSYSTFLGGTNNDWPTGIAADASGYAYVTGYTNSIDFPVTSGALHGHDYLNDAFVTKLNPSGTALVYSTFIGGSGNDRSNAIAINAGSAYITGNSSSGDFPVTVGNNGIGAFVVKLDSNGVLAYSNVLSDVSGTAIAVDSIGAAYMAGSAIAGAQVTGVSAQPRSGGGLDAFVVKLGAAGQLIYATFLGGSGNDAANAIAVDASGDAFVAGYTQSANFPFTAGAYSTSLRGQQNAFVAKLNPSGGAVLFVTYLGGSASDVANGVALDSGGNSYVVGSASSNDFPTTQNAFTTTKTTPPYYVQSAFVSKINATGTSLVYSTYIAGNRTDQASSVAVDNNGLAYVVGTATSNDFPTTVGAFRRSALNQYGDPDVFLVQLSADGSALQYSTLLGSTGGDNGNAVALDGNGGVYIAGATQSPNYPTTPGAFQITKRLLGYDSGSTTGAVSKIDMSSPTMCIPAVSPQSANLPGGGGTFSFNLTLSPGCPWEAVIPFPSSTSATITSATHGMGSSSPIAISGTLLVNTDPLLGKTTPVQIGTAKFTINQDPGTCADSIVTPPSQTFDSSGGFVIVILTIPSGCFWTVKSSAPWLIMNNPNPGSGTGSTSIGVTVPPNNFSQRLATIGVAGKVVTITQTGSSCTATASGSPLGFTGQGGPGVVQISPNSTNCAWAAYSYVPWIKLATSTGQGSGNVPFIVAPNPSSMGRSGQILIGDQTLTINQAAGPAGPVNSYATSLFAGGGSSLVYPGPGNLGDGGSATYAALSFPGGLAFDAVAGNVYIADAGNARVRVVTPDLNIGTLAGGGTSTAENVPALTAALRAPNAVGVDNSGSVYVSDLSARIREIKLGNIATFAGMTSSGFSGDNGPAISALMSSPAGVASDKNGNVYIADAGNKRVREVSGSTITTIAGGGTSGLGDGGPATSATLSYPVGIAFDGAGNLYIADAGNNRVRKVANGVITTVAGGGSGADGGPAASASLDIPKGIAFDPSGNMFIAESSKIRRVATDGTISTATPTNVYYNTPQGIAADRAGNVYFSEFYSGRVWKLAPDPNFCSYVVSTPGVQALNGGQLSIAVTAAAGCNWTASSDLPWASISSGSSGSGNGTVSLTIASNAGGQIRSGSIVIAGQTLLLTQRGITRIIGDFDRNGVPDIVWMNNSFRGVTVNYFGGPGGASYIGFNWLIPGEPSGWRVAAVADFDGNGVPDLVWVNDQQKLITVNYFGGPGGATYLGFNFLYTPTTYPVGWHIVGAGDFNGDGVPDLVWQNDTNGLVTVNYFRGSDGATYLGWNYLSSGFSGWHVAAVADFNGDSVSDLVWINDTTRQVTVHYYGGAGGATDIGWNWLDQGGEPGWHIISARDFDNNGTPDLVWYNDTTTQIVVDYYTGATRTGYAFLYPYGSPAGWSPIN